MHGNARVVAAHTGAEFESGAVYRARGLNQHVPGVVGGEAAAKPYGSLEEVDIAIKSDGLSLWVDDYPDTPRATRSSRRFCKSRSTPSRHHALPPPAASYSASVRVWSRAPSRSCSRSSTAVGNA